MTGQRLPMVSPAAWLTDREVDEQRQAGEALHATIHVAVPHGRGHRVVDIPVGLPELLVIAANAADAARKLHALAHRPESPR